MNVWRLIITHKSDPKPMLDWAQKKRCLSIGWGLIGSIKDKYDSVEAISNAIKDKYPGKRNEVHGGKSLYYFCYKAKPHDLVILGKNGKRYLVMEIKGEYGFDITCEKPPNKDYYHQREAIVLPINADKLWKVTGAGSIDGDNLYWTFIRCQKPIDEEMKAALMQ